jgi:hypothetical protein
MAEGNVSRYVKLTKEQTGVEEIKPGELNQPIEVPHVSLSLSLCFFLIFLISNFITLLFQVLRFKIF